jgi:2-dehydropantoate 2-reductase
MTPKFLIVGAGSVGIVYTYILSRTVPEKDIVAVCRSNHEIASTDGFKLHSAVWGENLQVKPIIVATAAEAVLRNEGRQFDYILISSKCIGPPSTWAEMIRPAATQGTVIILLQNGIGIEQPYALLYPKKTRSLVPLSIFRAISSRRESSDITTSSTSTLAHTHRRHPSHTRLLQPYLRLS